MVEIEVEQNHVKNHHEQNWNYDRILQCYATIRSSSNLCNVIEYC
jgi:hypothetical protein